MALAAAAALGGMTLAEALAAGGGTAALGAGAGAGGAGLLGTLGPMLGGGGGAAAAGAIPEATLAAYGLTPAASAIGEAGMGAGALGGMAGAAPYGEAFAPLSTAAPMAGIAPDMTAALGPEVSGMAFEGAPMEAFQATPGADVTMPWYEKGWDWAKRNIDLSSMKPQNARDWASYGQLGMGAGSALLKPPPPIKHQGGGLTQPQMSGGLTLPTAQQLSQYITRTGLTQPSLGRGGGGGGLDPGTLQILSRLLQGG
jgi:hypothetical protein